MKLRSLALVNFRNYAAAEIEFSAKINLIYGLNAQGKTNFLEGIYLLCLGRSFRIAKNQELLRQGEQSFNVHGKLVQDNEIERAVALQYIKDGKKEISVDRKRLSSHARIFGQFPVVVMAPDESRITGGGPSERRRFLDLLLSQVSSSYLADLQDYSRILKQRNKILQEFSQGGKFSESALVPWTENLVKVGSRVIQSRNRFIADFSQALDEIYQRFSESSGSLEVVVESSAGVTEKIPVEEAFHAMLQNKRSKEFRLGQSLVGPHRDDLVFSIGGRDLRKFGSRGEHKSVLFLY